MYFAGFLEVENMKKAPSKKRSHTTVKQLYTDVVDMPLIIQIYTGLEKNATIEITFLKEIEISFSSENHKFVRS